MLNHIIVNAYNLWVVVFAAIGTISTAYGLAIIGSTVGQPNFYSYFGLATASEPGYSHTTNIIAALNGVNSGGAIVGCVVNVWSAEKFGRKWTMIGGCVVLIIGGALCSGSVNIAMFIVGRGIAGLGSGILACVVPMYQAEVSTPETRGAMVSVTGIAYALGYCLAGWLGYACSFMSGSDKHAQFAWRFPLSFQCFFPLLFLIGQRFVPYSPRWLLSQGRRDEAFSVLCNLHKTKSDPHNIRAREEFYLIEKQYEMDASLPNGWFELFRTPSNRKRALMGFLLMFGNQFLGVYVMANYGVLIYAQLGEGGSIPLLLNACWTTLTISLWFVKTKFDRFSYVSEIFPNHLRSAGVALGLASFYLASEVTLVAAPIAMNKIGWKFYLVLICPSFFYIIVMYFLFPETKGRTLEEIGALFGDTHVANKWYDLSPEERAKIHEKALHLNESGKYDDENVVSDNKAIDDVKGSAVQQIDRAN
ncbi:uncharacterized protein PV09_02604 [Verruconis gallopava]|uniref:Major facilitator superfamily (MFS) profile domain-containing protein n=1 Tax=Verruconis gallopava TaxID=253628 RepID=A0A0D2AJ62_9PEZI|nr:uncharacterized protein PV09_02604 [Verruconis gallopava]KIW06943.1 hypothetical protein PV09_02604 [Verruconis gallopava]